MNDTAWASSLLTAALIGFYVAARYAFDGLGPCFVSASSRKTWSLMFPLAGVVFVAAGMGRSDVALGAAMAGAVAALGLAGGMVLLQSRPGSPAPEEGGSWPLIVPAAMALLMVGMSGKFGVLQVLALVVMAWLIVPAIRVPEVPVREVIPQQPASVLTISMILGALALACLGGWAAVEGAEKLAQTHVQASAGLLAACVLGPAAMMPLLGAGTTVATEGRTYEGMGMCIRASAVATLVLVPLAVIIAVVHGGMTVGLADTLIEGILFPRTLWRVECVLLAALGAILIPIGIGRIIPTRRDGAVVLGLYTLYLLLSAVSGLRQS